MGDIRSCSGRNTRQSRVARLLALRSSDKLRWNSFNEAWNNATSRSPERIGYGDRKLSGARARPPQARSARAKGSGREAKRAFAERDEPSAPSRGRSTDSSRRAASRQVIPLRAPVGFRGGD